MVRSLLQGLTNADDISDLQRRLRTLPPELEDFLQHIFDNLDPFYREQSGQIFEMMIETHTPPSVIAFDLTFGGKGAKTACYAHDLVPRPITNEEIEDAYVRTKKRLHARCKDLLEAVLDHSKPMFFRYQIDFLHRTVRDFLIRPDIGKRLQKWAGDAFDAKLSLCKASLAEIKMLPRTAGKRQQDEETHCLVFSFMRNPSDIDLGHDVLGILHVDVMNQAMTALRSNTWVRPVLTPWLLDRTFMELVSQIRLFSYLKRVLDFEPQLIFEKKGEPWILCAIRGWVSDIYNG